MSSEMKDFLGFLIMAFMILDFAAFVYDVESSRKVITSNPVSTDGFQAVNRRIVDAIAQGKL